MSVEIVTINRTDYDKLVADKAKLDKLRHQHLELKELIEKEGYVITHECGTLKTIIYKK